MNKSAITLAITMFITGTVLNSCDTAAQKVDTAQTKVADAQQNLKVAQSNADSVAQKAATDDEWKMFKNDAEAKIKNNEIRIDELQKKMKKSGRIMDSIYESRIDNLQAMNAGLKKKISDYDAKHGDWATFKTGFNHDMDVIAQGFKDLKTDKKK